MIRSEETIVTVLKRESSNPLRHEVNPGSVEM